MEKRFYYGGQAVVEGVMMRGQRTLVTAVRRPGGGLAIDVRTLSGIYASRLRKMPLIRGVIVLIESLVLGIKALFYSTNISLEEEEEEISGGMIWLIMLAAIVFAVALFFIAPLFLTKLFKIESTILFNLVDGAIRVAILISYLRLMSLIPDIRRTFSYHGAEHTVVNAYEAGAALETESVKEYGKANVRCGTSFIFMVLIISIFVFALIGLHSTWMMALSRVVLIPVIAAISYEAIYFGNRHSSNAFFRVILTPGLWLQSLTTRVPDDGQLDVALAALRRVVEIEQPEEVTWQIEEEAEPEEEAEEASPPDDSPASPLP
ncbi:DUF1385 domain-containing protein [Chloroflexota bacterium]